MTRDLGLIDCARIIAALEAYADDVETGNPDDAATYRQLADDIARCDRLVIVPMREEVGE